MADTLGIFLIARDHDRVHAGFMLAAGAASLGRPVVVFATGGGLHGLCRDWSALASATRDPTFIDRGIAGLDELREACLALGVRLLACDAGLRAEAIEADRLLQPVEIVGVTTFLSAAQSSIVCI